MDSIWGFEPCDPGSNPGAFTTRGYGVMDSITFCGVVDPGSNPGIPTTKKLNKNNWRWKK